MMDSKKKINFTSLLRDGLPDVLGLLIISIVSWNLTSDLERMLDIVLYDESGYLWWGVELPSLGLPDAAFAPLYIIWYYILSFTQHNPVDLYYLNYKVLTLLPALIFYLYVRVNKVNPLIALAASCLIVTCQGNLLTWPKVGHFALCILLGGLTLASLFKRPGVIFGITSMAALTASYTRPEYFLAYLISTMACCLICFRARRQGDYFVLIAVVVATSVAFSTLGYPLDGGKN